MLGKLFYHEFKNTGKVMLLLYALVGLLTLASISVNFLTTASLPCQGR